MKEIRCNLGLGTRAASRCLNSSGGITRCAVPSRQGVLSLSTTCPAALVCTRSLAKAGRVMDGCAIAPEGTDVTDAFRLCLRPLLGSGLPDAFRLRPNPVATVLPHTPD